MKRLIVIFFMFSGIGLRAQAMSHNKWEENDNTVKKTAIQHENEYMTTEMSVDGRHITFSDLPDLKRGTLAIITDAQGEVMSQRRVDPSNNVMDIHWLNRGQLYYVTLLYRNKSKKGFVLQF